MDSVQLHRIDLITVYRLMGLGENGVERAGIDSPSALRGVRIATQIDGKPIRQLTDSSYQKGMVSVGVVQSAPVQFDNFDIER